MKPANFPGRKLARQRGALERFKETPGKRPEALAAKNLERQRLQELTAMTDEQARGIRTKKDRTSRAKLGRNG